MKTTVETVCLVWATRKRHIGVNNHILCNPPATTGYTRTNGCYNSLGNGLPAYNRLAPDTRYTHTDGLILFKPLSEQDFYVNEKSVCLKCLKKFNSLIESTKNEKE